MRTRTVRPAVLLIGMCLLVTLPLVGCRTGPKKTSAASLVLARNGRAETCIVLGAEAVSAERTAAAELAAYLGKVTGGTFNVVAETEAPTHGMRLYVGPTKAARRQGVRAEALGPEEWVIRTTDDGLVLTGGRPRGTLYAVYRFLEDMVGVHWWNPWEETVPKLPALAVPRVNRRGKPTFLYRDVHGIGAFGDGGRFAARNRLNQQGADLASPSELISPEYGGDVPYGLPYHVHTSYMYVPPEEYFEKHPEWFSLINGERSAKRAQLCLTNQQLREHMVHKLEGYIETSRTEARAAGFPPPLVFDISQGDWKGSCQCEKCQATATACESEAGPLLDFLNYMADSLEKDGYSGVYIDTIAYYQTQKPPKRIKARDKIIVRLADTFSNLSQPITHPDNAVLREYIPAWSKVVKHLRTWDYNVTFGDEADKGSEPPTPTVHTYPIDLQFYAQHKVEGVFTQYAHPVLDDMRDFKLWMWMKLLEDPDRDYEELVSIFMNGFYGAGGKYVREYLRALEAAAAAKPSFFLYSPALTKARYLDLKFICRAQGVFDQAESAVARDAVLLQRVRRARLSLDLATIRLFRGLAGEWVESGNALKDMPLDRDKITKRCLETWNTEIARRFPRDYCNGHYTEKEYSRRQAAAVEMEQLASLPLQVGLPAKFKDRPAATVHDFMADSPRCWRNVVKLATDPAAESGIANRLGFSMRPATGVPPSDEYKFVDKYRLPMPWGLYDPKDEVRVWDGEIRPEDVPGPGYHWYKMGKSGPIGPSYYVYFFWAWIIQQDIGSAYDPQNPGQVFDVWARIKFEGPSFPHGQPGDRDAICVERVVVAPSMPAALSPSLSHQGMDERR